MKRVVIALGALLFAVAATGFAAGSQEATEESAQSMQMERTGEYGEAPMLAEMVRAGELPPVDERLPEEPFVVSVVEEIGQYGGTWRRALPSINGMGLHARIGDDSLVNWAPNGADIMPSIAKEYEVTDEGRVFTFYLREGMKWSDGEPFTAEDLDFWFNDVITNEEIQPSMPAWLVIGGEPATFEMIDDYTVRFSFAEPYGLFLQELAFVGRNMFVPKHYLTQFHASYADEDELAAKVKEGGFESWVQLYQNKADVRRVARRPVLGPWILENVPPATTLHATRNPYYWKVDEEGNQLPYIDRLAADMVESADITNARVAAGDADFEFQYLRFSNYTLFKENEDEENFRVLDWYAGNSGVTIFLNFNTTDAQVRDLIQTFEFRKALSLAIDRDEVNELIYLGMAEPAWKVFVPRSEWDESDETLESRYPDIVANFMYDPVTAEELLDSIGLDERDSDGFRLGPDGEPLTLTIEGYDGGLINIDGFDLVKDHWESVGIRTTVRPVSGRLWWPRIYSYEYQIAGYQLSRIAWHIYPRDYAPLQRMTYWAPEWGYYIDTNGASGVMPPAQYQDAIELYEQLVSATSESEREELGAQILRQNALNLWTIPTTSVFPYPVVAKDYFRNVPERGYWSWPLLSPGYLQPEQFFIEQ